ncbi:DMT family transporter [Actinokineospora iranica]|uniref:Transporter family-2 protein n=1 Tax=Actinokineospora iranica TaxID=1271860 RepID=A0A1G6SK63_9PSEU|nr:DMT family transporter [Actinokineospora iranica]SDD17064.1 transporter family-2 protein [Actinokineospora iranica]
MPVRALGAGLSLLGGVSLAAQARINGQLGQRLGDGVLAALVSFLVGLAIVVAAVAAVPAWRAAAPRFAAAVRTRRLRPWQCLGGVAGALFVTTQGLTVPVLGVAMFTVAGVGGQVVCGLLIDRAGFGPGDARPVTPSRALGAVLAVVAVGIAVSDEFGTPSLLWLALLPALTGATVAWAQAANGLVRAATDSVVFATLVNFAVGTVVLLLVGAVDVAVRGIPLLPPDLLLYSGGALGLIVVCTAVFAVRFAGVLMVSLCVIAGQVAGSVVLDFLAPAHGGGVAPTTLIGVAMTLVAAGAAAVPSGGGSARVRG